MTGLTGKDSAYAAIRNLPDPEMGYLDGHHADHCDGLPIFTQDSVGQWTAACDRGDFEITGCETRREAGARFYGGEQPGLYGPTGAGARALELVERLAKRTKSIGDDMRDLEEERGDGELTRTETVVREIWTAQFRLLNEYVDPDTGELR
jgi:hypothetical protein